MSDEYLNHIWHPCSQMKDYESFKPLKIQSAKGSLIQLADQHQVIDAISSWWCKSLGHNHPRLKAALDKQLNDFEHVIFANTTSDLHINLSRSLKLLSGLDKVFYAGDGSSAIETAMKMSLHSRQIRGQKKSKFLALKNGYHGETVGAMSVSDVGLYRNPYKTILFQSDFINPCYVSGIEDPLWQNAELHWQNVQSKLERAASDLTAIIIEPIAQGAGGMKIYSADFLKRLCNFARLHDIHIIADEIMTGIGRTGKWFASEYAYMKPDFMCVSKGLTSGWVAFSAVLTTDSIYDVFYDDYETGNSFLHSHTYSGNAVGASIALETLNIIEEENLCDRANVVGQKMKGLMTGLEEAGLVYNVRSIGAMVAADLEVPKNHSRFGYHVYQEAVKLGALLRPLGNTIYWMPPLNIPLSLLDELQSITHKAILQARSNVG